MILVTVIYTIVVIALFALYHWTIRKEHKASEVEKEHFHDLWQIELAKRQALEADLKTLKKQLQESTEDEAKQVHGKVFQARIYEKATPDVYQAVFEYTPNGQRVLQDLVNRFCGSAYTSDQNGGERETCRKLGQSEVVSHINRQIYMANNPEAFKQYGVDDE